MSELMIMQKGEKLQHVYSKDKARQMMGNGWVRRMYVKGRDMQVTYIDNVHPMESIPNDESKALMAELRNEKIREVANETLDGMRDTCPEAYDAEADNLAENAHLRRVE